MPRTALPSWMCVFSTLLLALVGASCEAGCSDDDDNDDAGPLDDDNDDQSPDDDVSPGDDDETPADDDESPADDDNDDSSPGDDDDDNDIDDDSDDDDDDDNDDDNDDDDNDDNDDDNDDDSVAIGDTFACDSDGVTTELLTGGNLDGFGMASDGAGKVYGLATRAGRLLLIEIETGQPTTISMVACWASHGALAADLSGALHVAYTDSRDGALNYAVRQGKEWTVEALGTGYAVGVGLDGAGTPYVLSGLDDSVMLWTRTAGDGWDAETLPELGGNAYPVSLAVSAEGAAHVLLQSTDAMGGDYFLQHQTNASGTWVSSLPGLGFATSPQALRLDDDGRPHAFYLGYPMPRLRHAELVDRGWTSEVIDSSAYYVSSLAATTDLGGVCYVAYTDQTSQHIRMAMGATGAWDITTVGGMTDEDETVFGAAVDLSGSLFVGLEESDPTLRLWDAAGGAWSWRRLLAGGERGEALSMAMSESGDIHLSYFSGLLTEKPLPFTHVGRVGGAWTRDTIVECQGRGDSALTVDLTGTPRFLWYDEAEYALKHAWLASGQWSAETVATGLHLFFYDTAAVDSAGVTHVAFNGSEGLTHCTDAGPTWVCEVVDAGTIHSNSIALAVGDAIGVRLAYLRAGETSLRYAWPVADGWENSEIDANCTTNPGSIHPSMKIDSVGAAHVAYYGLWGPLDGAVRYATNRTGSWVLTDVDDEGSQFVSLALDPSDGVHVVYDDQESDELRYAAKIGGAWSYAVIHGAASSGAGFSGEFNQLEYGPDSLLHAAYFASEGVWHATFPPGYTNP